MLGLGSTLAVRSVHSIEQEKQNCCAALCLSLSLSFSFLFLSLSLSLLSLSLSFSKQQMVRGVAFIVFGFCVFGGTTWYTVQLMA